MTDCKAMWNEKTYCKRGARSSIRRKALRQVTEKEDVAVLLEALERWMESISFSCAKSVFPVAVLHEGLAMITARHQVPSKQYAGFINEIQRRLFPCDALEIALEETTRDLQRPSLRLPRFRRALSVRKVAAIRPQVSTCVLQTCTSTKQDLLESLVQALKRKTHLKQTIQPGSMAKHGRVINSKPAPVPTPPSASVRSPAYFDSTTTPTRTQKHVWKRS
jgi:hypothetical protein